MIELGVKARDKVTGFKGIITGRASYLTGCDQYSIVPPIDKDGKLSDGVWFDESRVEVIGKGVSVEDVVLPNDPGGPQRDAPPVR